MWSFYVFSVLYFIGGVRSAIDERLKDDFFHIYKNAAIETRDIQNRPVTEDQVTFYLYTNENPKEFTAIDSNNLERFRNFTNQIVFLIHGWTNSRKSEWLENMKNAFLVRDKNSFVIIVDWEDPANQLYYVSSINTYDVGKFIAKLLVNLYKNYGVDKRNFLIVGHSLGGQVAGFIGKQFKKQTLQSLPRIIALDPAGPLFTTRPLNERLNKDDADVVEVVHTNGGTFGFLDACGTIDFFVNGGSSQPGCKRIDLADLVGSVQEPLLCDHRRSWAYFTEALLNPTEMVAQKCNSWAEYKISYCDKVTVPMGDLNTTLTGSFYLKTNKEPPYSKKLSSGFSLSRLISY
ncbi:unnamed protein product [Ceutorhynchus assimilis]|uniref:Lipase domain-containing protein n=1 Tax=Ceutorhynchus assimilis TaxID=467358 RepID=A0A9N9MCI7_9CUCU|nr:unnamed protein product [Ceutorhynchus assimilis]